MSLAEHAARIHEDIKEKVKSSKHCFNQSPCLALNAISF